MASEQLNDLDKQFLVRNAKILREVGYERDANNAIAAVQQFKETFFKCYNHGHGSDEVFRQMEMYLKVLLEMAPKAKKRRP